MFKVNASRFINYRLLGGRENQMLSSRVYLEDRKLAEKLINFIFFWQEEHCKMCFYSEIKSEIKRECCNHE
jgi:hypothetical protein